MEVPPPDAVRARKILKWLWKNYARDARRRDIPWMLALEEFRVLAALPCGYCGKPPSNKRGGVFYTGIDRKDNRHGYTISNCVPCCKQCNSIKGEHLTFSEMKAAMEAVACHRREKS
jgi:5-methylcytosine-specific restriction endonuclease McrA